MQQLQHETAVDGLQALADLGPVLDDRNAMLAVIRRALTDPAYGGQPGGWPAFADALGDADLTALGLRKELEAAEGFKEGTMPQYFYSSLWIVPYSSVRSHPEFKKLLVETGVVDYWRQTGKWGDGCGPVGANDFQCR